MKIWTFQIVDSSEIVTNWVVRFVEELDNTSRKSRARLWVTVIEAKMISRTTEVVADMQVHGSVLDTIRAFPNKGLD